MKEQSRHGRRGRRRASCRLSSTRRERPSLRLKAAHPCRREEESEWTSTRTRYSRARMSAEDRPSRLSFRRPDAVKGPPASSARRRFQRFEFLQKRAPGVGEGPGASRSTSAIGRPGNPRGACRAVVARRGLYGARRSLREPSAGQSWLRRRRPPEPPRAIFTS